MPLAEEIERQPTAAEIGSEGRVSAIRPLGMVVVGLLLTLMWVFLTIWMLLQLVDAVCTRP